MQRLTKFLNRYNIFTRDIAYEILTIGTGTDVLATMSQLIYQILNSDKIPNELIQAIRRIVNELGNRDISQEFEQIIKEL